ncbi:MAG: LysE family transporter [Hadesarchaea archaeon]|nr:LysE family transporter [Hadesarchaea archaeon]
MRNENMLESFVQLGVGFSVALSGALIPGPLLAFVAMKTLESGARTGTLAAIGHIIVELLLLALMAFGLRFILKSQFFMKTMGLVGGVLLFIVGVLIISKIRDVSSPQENVPGIKHHPLTGGVLFSTIFNPSVVLWWITVGLTTLMAAIEIAGIIGGAFWLIGHFLADLVWFSSISYSVDKGREIIGGTFYKVLLIACSSTLFIFGFYFVTKHIDLIL